MMVCKSIVFWIAMQHILLASACETGWFGSNCQFKCHCNTCDLKGQCTTGSSCFSGWFGPLCQYSDLASKASAITPIDIKVTDSNDLTCSNHQNIEFKWNESYQLTWFRIVLDASDTLTTVSIQLKDINEANIPCSAMTKYNVSDTVTDLFCNENVQAKQVIFQFQPSIVVCSIYISGGRNVALKESTLQSSTFYTNDASKAVDGKIGNFDTGVCTHTNLDNPSYWRVTFSKKLFINRYVLYNRENNRDRLKGFKLITVGRNNETVFSYTDTSGKKDQAVYDVTSVNVIDPSYTQISVFEFLTLCEVEIYGDNQCAGTTFGLECNNNCNCVDGQETCFVATGGCASGCAEGFHGEGCSEVCGTGWFGSNCVYQCHCTNNNCNKSGDCTDGATCDVGWFGLHCQSPCKETFYGANCETMCSTNCVERLCDRFNGSCNTCPPGNKGSFCNETCDDFHYGPSCLKSCSTNCTASKCNRTNGYCFSCYSGFTGEFCDRVCNKTHYGQNCQNLCDYCSGGICDNVNGTCDKCDPGRYGERCTPCRKYTYGVDCRENCSKNCAGIGECTSINGTCVDGCQPGYTGKLCNMSCEVGYYGKNCISKCSELCTVNETEIWCNKTDGRCLLGYESEPSNESDPHLAAIVVPIVVILTVALVAAALIFWRVRRSKKEEPAEVSLSLDVQSDPGQYDSGKHKPFVGVTTKPVAVIAAYCNDNIDSDSRVIPVSKLNEYMLKHSREFFVDEYRKLPVPQNVTMLAGQSEENKHKNRYKNICAYDHSRVHLEINTTNNEGDYINASYIEGYNNEEKFIASQGPNDVIINDFVRMLWEQKVDKVVMLTNLIEEGTVKAVKYWPEDGISTFGDIKVELSAMHVFADYTIRKLELKKKNKPVHQFTHFHFTSWPDKGVPLTPWGLVDFEQRVALGSTSKPIVVHCSAGVGRTGTFIALRNVMREAEDTGRINCFQTVAKLRQDRVLMVQTAEQYEFLHRAAQVAIICMGTTVTANDITARVKYLQESSVSGINNLEKEFMDVSKVSSDFNKLKETDYNQKEESHIYQNRTSFNDAARNRCLTILPSNPYRASLSCETDSLGEYINAVLISSFTKRENQILTQLPMPNTVTDFWRLVAQYNVKLVVAFQTESFLKDRSIGQYLPASMTTPLDCGPYEIHTGHVKSESLWEEQQITVKVVKKAMVLLPNGVTAETHVTHIASKSTDLNPKNLLKLLKHTRSNNVQAQGRVLYMCKNGAEYSGLACVLSLLLDRMDHDQSLTVPLVVGAIKCIRPQVIPSLDQYKCVYEVLKRYNELSTPYSNYDTISRGQQNITLSTTTQEDENIYANS